MNINLFGIEIASTSPWKYYQLPQAFEFANYNCKNQGTFLISQHDTVLNGKGQGYYRNSNYPLKAPMELKGAEIRFDKFRFSLKVQALVKQP